MKGPMVEAFPLGVIVDRAAAARSAAASHTAPGEHAAAPSGGNGAHPRSDGTEA